MTDRQSVSPGERARAVLEERARLLARPRTASESPDTLSLLTFRVHDETYAVEAHAVREVYRPSEVAPLPGAEPPVSGVTLWRGELLSIVDLRLLFDLPAAPAGERGTLFVVTPAGAGTARDAALGLAVDAPGELRTLPERLIRPPPEGLAGREYVHGMIAGGTLVLDVQRIWDAAGLGSA